MQSIKTVLATVLLALSLLGTAFANEKVNVNTADAQTLARVLHNVGPAKAEAIVEYRKANGPFKSAEQLALVKGIGLKTVERNRDRIEFTTPAVRRTVSAPTAAAGKGAGKQR